MTKYVARIRKGKRGLWLLVDPVGANIISVDDLSDPLLSDLDSTAYAIREEEVEPILEACRKYLGEKPQDCSIGFDNTLKK